MDAGTAPRLSVPFAISGGLHVVVLAALIISRGEAPPPQPPIYRVNLVAAPPGPRAIGTVTPPTPRVVPPTATPPPRSQSSPRDMPPPVTKPPAQRAPPVPATPTPTPTKSVTPTPAPPAGGGAQGGRGADVANVRIEGIVFPYTGYLENIVRQIALRFEPPNRNAPLRAVVSFLIHRDGHVSGIRLVTRSGVYAFDVESTGAIEAAAAAKAFGPLPSGYSDDVLPVVFSFDPSLIR